MKKKRQRTHYSSNLTLWHGGQNEHGWIKYNINYCLFFMFVFRPVFAQTVSWCKKESMTNLWKSLLKLSKENYMLEMDLMQELPKGR